jgi:ABC-type Fe3+ transport system permease subunit/DNA-binding beta-propeller fold protein YncE
VNWLLLKNSLLVSGLTTIFSVFFGLSAAMWFAGLHRAWRNVFFALAIIDLALPPFLVTNCWLHFLGDRGVWHSWLPLPLFSLGGTVWILTLLFWPITMVAVSNAWRRLEPAQLESDMAVTGWSLCRGLLFPIARTAVGQAAVLTFVLAINNFSVPAILQVKVSPAEMWIRFNTEFDTFGALKLCWPLIMAPLALVLWFAKRDVPWPHRQPTISAKLFRKQLGGTLFWICGCCSLFLFFVSVALPLLQLVMVSRTWTELPGAVAAGQTAIWNSLSFAAMAASAVVLLALLGVMRFPGAARFTVIAGFVTRWLLWLPFLMPGVLLGIGLIALFNRPSLASFYQSSGIVILAFVIRYFALGETVIVHAAHSVDRDLIDVARLEGATRWQTLRQVLRPQIGPQVAGAWYIVFLLCLWEVESMILVVPPGGETLALRIFNLLHYGHNAQVNALCVTLLVLALGPLLVWKSFCAVRRQALRNTLVALALVWFTSACTPTASSNDARLESKIFSEVQIIGHRGVGVGELNKPRSVAVDAQDNLYVADMTGRVQKFSSNGVFLLSWQMPQTDKGRPKGMCNDRQGGIVVNEPHYSRVNHFAPEGKLLVQWGVHGTNAGRLTFPRSVAVNSHDEIYVSEYGLVERVQRFTARGGKFLGSFGHAGTGPGEFNRPEGLFIDSQDRVYVADSCNHRIQVFTRDGQFLRTYGKPGRGLGELSYPYDICVDATGRQYVCEFGNSRIQVFDANDRPIEIIGGPGTNPGQFGNPWGVALDSAGNLYVADSQNHRVQKLIQRNAQDRNKRKAVLSQRPKGSNRSSNLLGFQTLDLGLWTLDFPA